MMKTTSFIKDKKTLERAGVFQSEDMLKRMKALQEVEKQERQQKFVYKSEYRLWRKQLDLESVANDFMMIGLRKHKLDSDNNLESQESDRRSNSIDCPLLENTKPGLAEFNFGSDALDFLKEAKADPNYSEQICI